MSEKLIVCCTPFDHDWHWMVEELAAPDVRFHYFSDQPRHGWQRLLQRPNFNTMITGFRCALYVKRHGAQLLISIDPRLSFWSALFCRLLRVQVRHLSFSFNFAELPGAGKRRLFGYAYQQLSDLRVHSHLEKKLYSEYFGIPEERIEVRLWTMNVPDVSADPPVLNGPYVSAVGSNARDYATLAEAARLLPDVPMVWVARPDSVAGLELPPNVHLLSNVKHARAMNIVERSRLTVVPLKGSKVPCGHVTLVSSMLLKKAIVATDSAGIADYVTDGWSGLLCHPQDPADMAEKIRALWDDAERAARLGVNGFQFAQEHCAERLTREDMSAYLASRGLAGVGSAESAAQPLGL